MIKKLILLLILVFTVNNFVSAQEYQIKIKPIQKISTSDVNLKEGDYLDFTAVDGINLPNLKIEKGQKITGLLTNLEANDFWVKPASVYVENFKTKDSNDKVVKLNGIVYKQGNDHRDLVDFIFFDIIRGGEVQIDPQKDSFYLFLEDNL